MLGKPSRFCSISIAIFVSKTFTIHQKSMKTMNIFSHVTFVVYGIIIMYFKSGSHSDNFVCG